MSLFKFFRAPPESEVVCARFARIATELRLPAPSPVLFGVRRTAGAV